MVDVSLNRNWERPPQKCFRCGSEDHMIAKFPKPPKYNEKRRKQVRFNEKGNRACDNDEGNNDHKIYAYMERMSSDDKLKSVKYGDSSQLTTCKLSPYLSLLRPLLLYICVIDVYILWSSFLRRCCMHNYLFH